ncbi:MAG: hypothetical protein DRJ69_03455 [Thermoprotei archaeon]|nr:MAG: hypothetical protein DRJ69_03455 [Thermoprotei archaeon]
MANMTRVLVFLLTYGVSLDLWSKRGIFSREIKAILSLSKLYDKVYIISYGDRRDMKYHYILPSNVYVLSRPNTRMCYFVHSLLTPLIYRRLLRKHKIIVCRTVQLLGYWTGLLLKLLYGAKLILRQGYQCSKFLKKERALIMYVTVSLLELIAYQLADAIIVTSESDREYIARRYRVNPRKVYVIPNWVDTNLFKPLPGVVKKRGRVVFVGRLEYQKNLFALIDAVRDIPGVKLYVVGDGGLRKVLENRIKREAIDNIVFLGVVPHVELPWELNKSEIFVLPSLWEGHPKTLIEAMACGLPVIGSNVEGIRELIKDGYNGVLCEPISKSIREAVLRLLRNSERRRRLGENARRFVVENFSFEKIMRKELALHLWLIRQCRGKERGVADG